MPIAEDDCAWAEDRQRVLQHGIHNKLLYVAECVRTPRVQETRQMDIRRLRYFASVAELGSFTKAATLLHIAQPALSRHVRELEDEVGLELLSRQGRQTRLTDAGEALLRHAHTIERDFERLVEDMQARRGTPKGRVIFGIPPTLAESLVLPVTDRIKRELPLISIKVVEGLTPVLSEWVQNNRVDMAVLSPGLMSNRDTTTTLQQRELAQEEMVVAEKAGDRPPPRYYSLRALRARPLVVSNMLLQIVQEALHPALLELKVDLEIDSVQAIKSMVAKGAATTILPISMLREEIAAGTVTASAITEQGVRRTLSLAQHRHRQMTTACEAVARVISEEADRILHSGGFSLERKPTVNRPADEKPADKKAAEKKAAGKRPTNEKPTDGKPGPQQR
jgi:LysR family nitrogen assimilation transcriptional regulator